jgi:hypothetical protein
MTKRDNIKKELVALCCAIYFMEYSSIYALPIMIKRDMYYFNLVAGM